MESIVWAVWLARNAWCFENVSKDPMERIAKAVGIIGEYDIAAARNDGAPVRTCGGDKWRAPPDGVYKVNSDAALFGGWMGVGAMMRDSVGDIMVAMCDVIEGDYEVEVAEAMAARLSLKTALEAGLLNIILETDSLKLYYALKKKKMENTAFGRIIRDIFHVVSFCNSVSFSHVKKNGNRAAHALARKSLGFNEYRVWIEEAPIDVQDIVLADSMPE